VLTAQKFANLPRHPLTVLSSPLDAMDDPLDENIYHAHVEMPEQLDSYLMALHLRELYERYGTIQRVDQPVPNRASQLIFRGRMWLAERLRPT
jgi:hypothetical protein